jgi:hypothetical protein
MKKQDLSKLALLGVIAAGTISGQVFGQSSSGYTANTSSSQASQPSQASASSGSSGAASTPGYTQYNPNVPVKSDDQYDGSKGIKQGVVTNSGRSDQTGPSEQVCVGTTTPQAGTLPKSLPGSPEKSLPSKVDTKQALSEKCSSCGGDDGGKKGKGDNYSDGKASSSKNSAVLKAKRSQSGLK